MKILLIEDDVNECEKFKEIAENFLNFKTYILLGCFYVL